MGTIATWHSVHQILSSELAEHVIRAVHHRSVRPALTEHTPLLADLAQQHLDLQCPGPGRVGVEQVTQELVGGTGLGHQQKAVADGYRAPRCMDGGGRRVEEMTVQYARRFAETAPIS